MILTAHFDAHIIKIYGYQTFGSMKPVVANAVSNQKDETLFIQISTSYLSDS